MAQSCGPATRLPPGFSQFTSWLVEGLEKGEAAPDDEQITMDALYHYLLRRARSAGAAATPQRIAQGGVGDLVISANPLMGFSQIEPEIRAALAAEEYRTRMGAVAELTLQMDEIHTVAARAARRLLQRHLQRERDFQVRRAITRALEEGSNRPSEVVREAEEEERRAEAARQAEEEKQRAEAARQAEEKKQRAEAARQAEEEKQRAEAAQQAEEEKQRAEAARQAEEEERRVEAARQAEEQRRAEAARAAAEEKRGTEAARLAVEKKQRADAARELAKQFAGQKHVYVELISVTMERNARAAAGVPESEDLSILFDYTVFGPMNCMVAAESGIFYRHANANPKSFVISYERFRDTVIADRFWGGIRVGNFNMTFAGGNKQASCDFLRALQARLKASRLNPTPRHVPTFAILVDGRSTYTRSKSVRSVIGRPWR